jgi:hypothetical protein
VYTYQTALVTYYAIASHKHVPSDRLSKNLNTEHVLYYFLGLTVNVRVNKRHIVIACNHVAECRQTLLYALNFHGVWQAVAKMLQLLISRGVWYEQSLAVTDC